MALIPQPPRIWRMDSKLKKDYSYLLLRCESGDNQFDKIKDYIKTADEMIKVSDGLINYYRTQSHSHLAFDIWRMMTKNITEPQELLDIEHYIIDKAYRMGIHSCVKGEHKNVVDIDMNSMFNYYMSQSSFMFPMKQPTNKMFTNDEFHELKFYPFGFYFVEIETLHEYLENFQLNREIWVTHHA